MAKTHNPGLPRSGGHRELKFAQESYWVGQSSRDQLRKVGADLRGRRWKDQVALNLVPVGDFAFYDQALDMSFTLGNLPAHVRGYTGDGSTIIFAGRVAAGWPAHGRCSASNPKKILKKIEKMRDLQSTNQEIKS
jgi:5-methyltetrahydropteroyltriglutamate--homocysteine methyltransferase